MDVIKKKMQAMKLEKDNAMDKADTCEGQAKEANLRADKVLEEVGDLTKKLAQVEADLEANKQALEQANRDLEDREKSLTNVSIISTCFTYLYSSYDISLLHCNK
jgi:chromosome segregation ATPase